MKSETSDTARALTVEQHVGAAAAVARVGAVQATGQAVVAGRKVEGGVQVPADCRPSSSSAAREFIVVVFDALDVVGQLGEML